MARVIGSGVATAMVAIGLGAAMTHGSALAQGWVCTTEEHSWFGEATLGAGESFATGVSVAAEAGTELHVNAVDYAGTWAGTSEGEVVAVSAVAVRIGDAPVAGGSLTGGGELGATNNSGDTVHVTSLAVSIDRCSAVDQAASIAAATLVAVGEAPTPDQPLVPVQPPPLAPPTAAPSAAVAPSVVAASPAATLPATGSTSLGLILAAFACSVVGVNFVALSRWRRPTAGVRG